MSSNHRDVNSSIYEPQSGMAPAPTPVWDGPDSAVNSNRITPCSFVASSCASSAFDKSTDEADGMNAYANTTDEDDMRGPTPSSPSSRYEQVIQEIVQLEADCVQKHREYLDDDMQTIKLHFQEIDKVEQPQASVEDYVRNVMSLLEKKQAMLHGFYSKMSRLQSLLEEEETLARQGETLSSAPAGGPSNNMRSSTGSI